MTEDPELKNSPPDSGSKVFAKSKDKKTRAQKPLTKIIFRRLPSTMTEESFLEQVSPIPEHDYFCFAKPDLSLGNNVYSRAYINFINVEDIYLFRDKFDGYIFLDDKGLEYVGIVEYAPFQRIPKKKKKKDPKSGTIETDPVYQEFVENLNKEQETDNQPKLEYSYPVNDGSDKKVQTTPLLEYLASRKQDKRGRDERRRRENDKRKMRIERKMKEAPIKEEDAENEVKKIKPRDWDKEKSSSKSKEDVKGDREGTVFESKTYKERKMMNATDKKKKYEADKKDDPSEDGDKTGKRERGKDSPRESKSKKYSDTRKERLKAEALKDKYSNKSSEASDAKPKLPNHDDIKPFTQLPQVKTDDLTKIIEGMEKKAKLSEGRVESKVRRNSMGSADVSDKEETQLKRQKSLDDRGKSTDREGSEDNEKSESSERRADRRIRNKDRPSIVIYQPGMGRFSKQRITKEKDGPSKSVGENEKKDT